MSGRFTLGLCCALSLGAACGPSENRGPIHRVYLDDPPAVSGTAGGGGDAGAAAGPTAGGEAGAPEPELPPVPPSVTAMMPLSGAYGSEIRIQGEGLGSPARADVHLLLGADGAGELTPSQKPEVLSWSETEIRFRFPFPYEGRVVIETPQGMVEAGEFEPTWQAGPALASLPKVTSSASLASAPGTIAAVLDTGPPSLVMFDGSEWVTSDIAAKNLRADSIRLFLDGSVFSAFGLSTALAPEILALDPVNDFAQTASGLKVTSDYRVAGGPDGATVWSRTGNNWSRARAGAGAWSVDKGPIADPNATGPHHVAGALSDGSLFVAWSIDTGTTFDDRGAVEHRRLAADAAAFEAVTRTGGNVDDAVSSITLFDRGSGLVARYCGTDKDPFGVTGNETLCYLALLPGGSKMTLAERPTLRYAFGPDAQAVAYCSASKGLRIAPALGTGTTDPAKLDTLAGDTVAWPCPNVVAVELDPDGEPLLILEQAGDLYAPRPRVH